MSTVYFMWIIRIRLKGKR